MNPLINYINIRDQIKTGDIVLFQGKGLFSTVIRASGDKTHVGVVVNFPEYDFKCILESTTLSTIRDLGSGEFKKGVQIVPLSKRISSYNGKIWIRQLENFHVGEKERKILFNFRREFNNRPYEKSKIDLIGSAFDILNDNEEDLTSVFCSETVGELYQRWGILPDDVPSDSYSPTEFSITAKKPIELLNGAKLADEEIRIA